MTEYAGLIFSPLINIILDKFGRKTVILSGFLILTLGTLALALLDFVGDSTNFFLLALVIRFIQGIGDTFTQTTMYSLLSSSFPHSRDKIFGYIETASGIGLMIGPNVASPVNSALGYLPAYFVFTVMLAISGIIVFFLLPDKLNNKFVIAEEDFNKDKKLSKAVAPYSWYFCNKRCLFALFTPLILNFIANFK
jgi:MFS family permease